MKHSGSSIDKIRPSNTTRSRSWNSIFYFYRVKRAVGIPKGDGPMRGSIPLQHLLTTDRRDGIKVPWIDRECQFFSTHDLNRIIRVFDICLWVNVLIRTPFYLDTKTVTTMRFTYSVFIIQATGSPFEFYIIGRVEDGKFIPYLDGMIYSNREVAYNNCPK